MLTEVQKSSRDDVGVLRGIGRALLLGKQPLEALRAFERVAQLLPDSASAQEDAGVACLESGQLEKAAAHLERALELDPLLLPAATSLQTVYQKQGASDKAEILGDQMRRAMSNAPAPAGKR
jgi:tetratricopeptide (TPR) repeat protein